MMTYNNKYAILLGVFMDKICGKCKKLLDISLFSKDKYQKSGYRRVCKSCSSLEFQQFQSTDGYKKRLAKSKEKRAFIKKTNPIMIWAHDVFHNAKKRSKDYGIEFSITKEWLVKNAPSQCPLLGVNLKYNTKKSEPNTASIDRKDSTKGYTSDNCKIISFKANRIKNNATLSEIQLLAQNLSLYY